MRLTRPFLWMAIALAAAPAFAWLVYRVAKGLGFLDPPVDRQHELRRTIVVAIYAFLLFLPVLFYGFEKGWPRAWVLFGFVDGLALLFFAGSGFWAGRSLWKLRHSGPVWIGATSLEGEPDAVAEAADRPDPPLHESAAGESPALGDRTLRS